MLLLERSTHHVALTTPGAAFLVQARQILAQVERAAVAASTAVTTAPTLRVGSIDAGYDSMPQTLHEVQVRHPELVISARTRAAEQPPSNNGDRYAAPRQYHIPASCVSGARQACRLGGWIFGTVQEMANGPEHNMHLSWDHSKTPASQFPRYEGVPSPDDMPPKDAAGMSAFALEDDVVHRTHSAYARVTDVLWGMFHWLDRASKGRGATKQASGINFTTPTTRIRPRALRSERGSAPAENEYHQDDDDGDDHRYEHWSQPITLVSAFGEYDVLDACRCLSDAAVVT